MEDQPLDETVINIIYVISYALLIFLNIHRLKKTCNLEYIPIWLIPTIIGIYLSIPIILFTFSIFAIFRQLINAILKIKHKSKFNGLLKGADSLHMLKEGPRHLMNCLIMFQCTKEMSPQVFYGNIKEIVRKMHKYDKLNSKFSTFCGYSYMLKKELNIDDCMRKMKTVGDRNHKISRSELLSLINECCNLDLPNDNTVPWEVIVGTQKVNWKNDDYDYYPLLYRCDHVIGDGITVMEIIVKMFSNEKKPRIKYELEEDQHLVWMENFAKITLKGLYMLLLFPAFCISNFIIKAKDDNILRGPNLSKQVFYWLNMDNSSGYIEKIKTIKNTILGISFPDVVMTAFSASLNDYFIKKSIKLEYISTAVPVLPGSSKLQQIIPEKLQMEDASITNRFSMLVMKVPIYVGYESSSIDDLRKRMDLIKKQSKILKDSLEYEMTALVINAMCTCLPQKIYEWIINTCKCTAIFSILPGPPKVYCWQDSAVISDIAGFGPHAYGIGTGVTINTYDGRLNIGINVDTSLIPCQEDIKEIADNILKHIDELYKHMDDLKVFQWSE